MKYKLNSKNPEMWGTEAYNGIEIDDDELNRLSIEWDKPKEELLNDLEEIANE